MLLHFGFEKPTPEIMKAWQAWFASIAECQIAQGGFSVGKEISKAGTSDLAWDLDSITGYNIVEAEDMAARLFPAFVFTNCERCKPSDSQDRLNAQTETTNETGSSAVA
jgi:hypothetical protein